MITIGTQPVGSDFVKGARFVLAAERHPAPDYIRRIVPELVVEVVDVSGDEVTAVDHLGGTHTFRTWWNKAPTFGDRRYVLWMGPLPNGTPAEIIAAAEALMKRERRYSHNHPLLVHATARDDTGDVIASLVMPAGGDRTGWHGHEDVPGREIDGAFVPDVPIRLRAPIAVGMELPGLFLVNGYQAEPDWDAPTLDKGVVDRVAGMPDLQSVGAWMPTIVERSRMFVDRNPMGLGSMEEIEYEISCAHARTERDELLVVAIRNPETGELHATHLAKTGIRLHDVDTVDDSLWDFSEGEGVWLGSDVAWYNGGDDGWDWEAGWGRATSADLERLGVDLEEIAEHVRDQTERPCSVEDVAKWMAPSEEGAPA